MPESKTSLSRLRNKPDLGRHTCLRPDPCSHGRILGTLGHGGVRNPNAFSCPICNADNWSDPTTEWAKITIRFPSACVDECSEQGLKRTACCCRDVETLVGVQTEKEPPVKEPTAKMSASGSTPMSQCFSLWLSELNCKDVQQNWGERKACYDFVASLN